jgi:proteic killer suppression protein
MALDVNNAKRYYSVMIRTFADKNTQRVFNRERVKKFSAELQRAALRKLLILHAAQFLDDLRVPPGNRLEKLKGDREGQHSIRINDQWRICFAWTQGDASSVEITDYH